MGNSARPSRPAAPNLASVGDLYSAGTKAELQYDPQLLAQDMQARQQYAPGQAQLLADTYGQAAPQVANTNYQILQRIDPQFLGIRQQYGQAVGSDLANGTSLGPDFTAQLQNYVRAAQAARGNSSGSAPVSAESAYLGQAALQLYQQRLANANAFLHAPTPESQFGSLLGAGATPVAALSGAVAAPGYQYYSPQGVSQYANIGVDQARNQVGLYGQQVGLYQTDLRYPQNNPWMGALSGAMSGAQTGAQMGGGYGAAAGAILGGVGGYFGTNGTWSSAGRSGA